MMMMMTAVRATLSFSKGQAKDSLPPL